jgi:putative tricarboxylic transport membrane protein
MTRKDLFSSFFFMLLSTYVCRESLNLGFGSFAKPGPGFLPFLVSLTLGLLSLAVFTGILLKKGVPGKTEEEHIPWVSILLTFSALIGFTLLLKTLGFNLITSLFLLFLLRAVGKKSWAISFLVSLGITFCTYLLFGWFLESQLPVGIFGF